MVHQDTRNEWVSARDALFGGYGNTLAFGSRIFSHAGDEKCEHDYHEEIAEHARVFHMSMLVAHCLLLCFANWRVQYNSSLTSACGAFPKFTVREMHEIVNHDTMWT
ncbi:MAG TPA: hypothetical protein VJG64_01205 [Candidatus Paceibacterota bacterium]